MKFLLPLAVSAFGLAFTSLAQVPPAPQPPAPLPAPGQAPVYQPAPAYQPAPVYAPAPSYPLGYAPQRPPQADTIPWTYNVALMPLSFLGSGLELATEFYLPATLTSIRFNAGLFIGSNPWFYDDMEDYTGGRVEAQVRFHLLSHPYAPRGVYIGPYVQYKYTELRDNDPDNGYYTSNSPATYQAGALGLGVVVGYQERGIGRFVFDAYGGGGLIAPTGNNEVTRKAHLAFVAPYQRGIYFHGGIGLGLAPHKRAVPVRR